MTNIYFTNTTTEQPKSIWPTVGSVAGIGIILITTFPSLHLSDGTNIHNISITPNNILIENNVANNSKIENSISDNIFLSTRNNMLAEAFPTYNEDISKLELNSLNIGQRPTQEENLTALAEMYDLDADWFDPIDRDLLAKTEGMIYALNVQPEIFPVPNGHIQLEYDTEDGRYMELELFPDRQVRMIVMQNTSKPIHKVFGLDVNKINQVVEMFYDGKF